MKKPHRVFLMMRPPAKIRLDYLVLAALFLVGVIAGHLMGGSVTDHQHQELADYLFSYAQSAASRQTVSLAGVVFSYFRGPLFLFLMGLAICGVWLIPLFIMGQGFSLAFSVHCFSGVLGRRGILLAFVAFGIRCLFVLPCCFFLASRSWSAANRLRKGEHLRDRRVPTGSTLYPLIVCGVVLSIGCVMEISLVPRLFSLIMSHISP